MSSSSRSFVTTNAVVVFNLLVGFASNAAIAAVLGLRARRAISQRSAPGGAAG